MASISPLKVLYLLFTVIAVSAAWQHPLSYDYGTANLPYICNDFSNVTLDGFPLCCYSNPNCSILCPGFGAFALRVSSATEVLGTVDVAARGDRFIPVQTLADLSTRRNFITSTLVQGLGLGDNIKLLADVDIHTIEVAGCKVTIKTFIPLTIRVGIDGKVLANEIFEIISRNDNRGEPEVANLVLGLNFLHDAGALAINQAIFTNPEQAHSPCRGT